jgi:hypothetical protein
VAGAKAEVRAKSGTKSGGDALRRRRNMKGGVFPKKRNEIRRSAKVREGRSEGAKRRERCLEVGNGAKRRGMISEGVLKESIIKRKIKYRSFGV